MFWGVKNRFGGAEYDRNELLAQSFWRFYLLGLVIGLLGRVSERNVLVELDILREDGSESGLNLCGTYEALSG